MASATSFESGFTPESQRFKTLPSGPIRNLPKFHLMSPGKAASFPVRCAYNGCCSAPFTWILSKSGNDTLYFVEQNSLISLFDPGSCEPKSLHGTPTTVKPRSL